MELDKFINYLSENGDTFEWQEGELENKKGICNKEIINMFHLVLEVENPINLNRTYVLIHFR